MEHLDTELVELIESVIEQIKWDFELVVILQNLGIHAELVEVKDSEMEDGAY